MKYLRDIPEIKSSITHLTENDATFKIYNIQPEQIPWKMFEPGFEGLTRTLQSQQISSKVADLLWVRLKNICDGTVTPEKYMDLDDDTLKHTGFTRQKMSYMRQLCAKIQSGTFDLKSFDQLEHNDLFNYIVSLKGFGPWSAHVFLLFSKGNPNILPKKDLVIDNAIKRVFSLQTRPPYEQALELTQRWDGKLSAVTLLLWAIEVNNLYK